MVDKNLITEISRIKSLILEQDNPPGDDWEPIKKVDKDGYPKYTVKQASDGTYFKTKKETNSAGTPTNDSVDFPPCAKKKGAVIKTLNGVEVIKYKTTVWDKPNIQLYAKDNRFMVLDGEYKDKKGNYKCTESGGIFLKLDKTESTTPAETEIPAETETPTDFPLDPKAETWPGDPYQYKMVDGVWWTKSWKNRGPGRIINGWESLKKNLKATNILNDRMKDKDVKDNKPSDGSNVNVTDDKSSDSSKVNVVNPKITAEIPNKDTAGVEELVPNNVASTKDPF